MGLEDWYEWKKKTDHCENYEPDITKLILQHLNPNKDAINIGANIGLFANFIASNLSKNATLVAIEPTKNAYNLLVRNTQLNNNESKIKIYKGIITDIEGDFEINTIDGMEEYSSVGSLVHQAIKNQKFIKENVDGITLNSLITKFKINPDLVVVDVEGAELKVFKGGLDALKKYKPIIISELDDSLLKEQNTTSTEVISLLENIGYYITNAEGKKPSYPFSGNIVAKFKS